MAIIRCPDCGSDVPEAASACLGCGRSMQLAALQMETKSGGQSVYQQFFGALGCLIGVVLLTLGILKGSRTELVSGAVVSLIGLVAFVSGRMKQ